MDCTFCKDALFSGEKKLKVTPCGHVFHLDCWDLAERKGISQCPLCRKRLMHRRVSTLYLTANDVPPSFVKKVSVDQKHEKDGIPDQMQSSIGINTDQSATTSSSDTSHRQPVVHSVEKKPEKSTEDAQPMEIHNNDAACDGESIDSGTIRTENVKPMEIHNNDAAHDAACDDKSTDSDSTMDSTLDSTITQPDSMGSNNNNDVKVILHKLSTDEISELSSGHNIENDDDAQKLPIGSVNQTGNEDASITGQSANSITSADDQQVNGCGENISLVIDKDPVPSTSGHRPILSTSSQQPNNGASGVTVRSKNVKKASSKSVHYDRNVRMGSGPHMSPQKDEQNIQLRLRNRVSEPVNRFKFASVKCTVCKNIFLGHFDVEYYTGPIVCSFECFRKVK